MRVLTKEVSVELKMENETEGAISGKELDVDIKEKDIFQE